jgi:hypothetical protein
MRLKGNGTHVGFISVEFARNPKQLAECWFPAPRCETWWCQVQRSCFMCFSLYGRVLLAVEPKQTETVYMGTSIISNAHPPRITIWPFA